MMMMTLSSFLYYWSVILLLFFIFYLVVGVAFFLPIVVHFIAHNRYTHRPEPSLPAFVQKDDESLPGLAQT